MKDSATANAVRFGPFEVDLRARELRKNGLKIRLQEKPFQLLVILLEHSGDAVTREELRRRLWSADTFVDFDRGLGTAMGKLRQALGDSADEPRFIETLPRLGFRFTAPVGPAPGSGGPRLAKRVGPLVAGGLTLAALALLLLKGNVLGLRDRLLKRSNTRIQSLAVLPFENLSRDPTEDYLADGITDELITDLAQIQALRVISRTSTMPYKGKPKSPGQIAHELNVDALVEGTVLRSADRVRVSAQLVEAAEDRHLWAESYERDLRDVLALQREVARAIAEKVQGKLTPQERSRLANTRPVNAEAYEAYLRGTFYWNRNWQGDVKRALDSFDQAIKKDSTYAPAYVGLADCYFRFANNRLLPRGETYTKGKTAAMKALVMDDTLSEAHALLAEVLFRYDWDWTSAEREFQRAVELSPSSASARIRHAFFLTAMGKTNEALAEGKRACVLDPVSHFTCEELGQLYFYAHQLDQAIEVWRRTLELYPDSASTRYGLSRALAQKGLNAEAVVETLKAEQLWGADQRTLSTYRHAYSRFGISGIWRKEIEMARYPHPFDFARLYARLGEKDQALKWLEKSFDERDYRMVLLKVEPELDGLHSSPRFQNLVQRVGLPP